MPVLYRPQRGGLMASMKEAMIFQDMFQMKRYLLEDDSFGRLEIEIDQKTFNDHRIGWKDTRLVYIYDKLIDDRMIIGYCATDVDFEELYSSLLERNDKDPVYISWMFVDELRKINIAIDRLDIQSADDIINVIYDQDSKEYIVIYKDRKE